MTSFRVILGKLYTLVLNYVNDHSFWFGIVYGCLYVIYCEYLLIPLLSSVYTLPIFQLVWICVILVSINDDEEYEYGRSIDYIATMCSVVNVFTCVCYVAQFYFNHIVEISSSIVYWKFISTDFVLDRLSLTFISSTTLLMLIAKLISFPFIKQEQRKLYYILLFCLEFAIIGVSIARDILMFYIFFEMALPPMLLLIGIYGSRSRRIFAMYKFVLYTLFGSFLLLFAIIYIYIVTGSTNFLIVNMFYFTEFEAKMLWLAFFVAFAVKIPIFPFHSWLPEAHVEASTAGSVISAGILSKLGGYGLLRFNITLFPVGLEFFRPFVLTLCVISVLYASLLALVQIDIKKFVAYSSIAHMNLAICGLLINSEIGLMGAVFSMLSHGITSSALFILVGELYRRYGSRYVGYYGGLNVYMPFYTFFFFMFTLGNMAVPGTSAFVGEILLYTAMIGTNIPLALYMSPQIILTAGYSIWFYNRIVFGNRMLPRKFSFESITYDQSITYMEDFDSREIHIMSGLLFFLLLFGIFPNFLIGFLNFNPVCPI